jgi:hypothetical protein
MSQYDEHRKYIHELANTLSILEGNVSRVLTMISRAHPEMKDEVTRLMKADEYCKKSIHTLKQFREHVHKQINEDAAKSSEKE